MDKVLEKSIRIVEALSASAAPRGVTELSQELGLVKSNVHRLLSSLVELGVVRQVPENDRYELTLRLWQLGYAALARLNVKDVAIEHMHKLRDAVQEDVVLSALEGKEVLYLHRLKSGHVVRASFGGSNPAYCSSTGKAILAWSSPEKTAHVLEGAVRFTDRTIVTAEAMEAELHHIRERGFALNIGEWSDSVHGVAAPIFNHDGKPIAALSVSGPAHRLEIPKMEAMGPLVAETTMQISRELGYTGQQR